MILLKFYATNILKNNVNQIQNLKSEQLKTSIEKYTKLQEEQFLTNLNSLLDTIRSSKNNKKIIEDSEFLQNILLKIKNIQIDIEFNKQLEINDLLHENAEIQNAKAILTSENILYVQKLILIILSCAQESLKSNLNYRFSSFDNFLLRNEISKYVKVKKFLRNFFLLLQISNQENISEIIELNHLMEILSVKTNLSYEDKLMILKEDLDKYFVLSNQANTNISVNGYGELLELRDLLNSNKDILVKNVQIDYLMWKLLTNNPDKTVKDILDTSIYGSIQFAIKFDFRIKVVNVDIFNENNIQYDNIDLLNHEKQDILEFDNKEKKIKYNEENNESENESGHEDNKENNSQEIIQQKLVLFDFENIPEIVEKKIYTLISEQNLCIKTHLLANIFKLLQIMEGRNNFYQEKILDLQEKFISLDVKGEEFTTCKTFIQQINGDSNTRNILFLKEMYKQQKIGDCERVSKLALIVKNTKYLKSVKDLFTLQDGILNHLIFLSHNNSNLNFQGILRKYENEIKRNGYKNFIIVKNLQQKITQIFNYDTNYLEKQESFVLKMEAN